MNWKDKFKFFIAKLFHLKPNFGITPKGDCLVRYIINKYINCDKRDDYIETYEQTILKFENFLNETDYKSAYMNEDGTEDLEKKHFCAAIYTFKVLVSASNNVDKYCDLINDEEERAIMKGSTNFKFKNN